jgi:toxin-antitoxin system PIN domain toxin
MPGVIDTNILLYAANRDAQEQSAARGFLHKAGTSSQQWYLTEGILYEFMRVSTHARVFSKPLSWKEALSFLRPFLESPAFTILSAGEKHWRHLEDILEKLIHPSGNLFFDTRTAVLLREHGIREIFTTDTDFLQFPDIEVINPLRPRDVPGTG